MVGVLYPEEYAKLFAVLARCSDSQGQGALFPVGPKSTKTKEPIVSRRFLKRAAEAVEKKVADLRFVQLATIQGAAGSLLQKGYGDIAPTELLKLMNVIDARV